MTSAHTPVGNQNRFQPGSVTEVRAEERHGELNLGPAHYESVDGRFHHVHSRPDQRLDTYAGPGRTGMNGNPVCNPWSSIRVLLDTRSTDALGNYLAALTKCYMIV
jgi:hypothetical protein